MRQFFRTLFALLFTLLLAPGDTPAQEVRPESDRLADGLALHHLFGGTQLASNAGHVCETASLLSEDAAYERLAAWVLPGESHPDIRLIGVFRTMESATEDELNQASLWDRSDSDAVLRKLLQRGAVRSPALKLIEAAHSAGKLDELQEQIDSIIPVDQEMQRAKLTLQFLTQIALQEDLAARTTFGKFFESSVEADRSKLTTRWNDFLVIWAGMHAPELRKTVGTSYFDLYRDPSDASPQSQLEVVTDYIRALQGTYQHLVLHNTNLSPVDGRDLRSHWIPVSSTSAATRGIGKPRAFWETADGQAFRITGHQTDYLIYRVPLRGNFQVECNAHPSLSRSLSLMVAGTYAAMNDNSHMVIAGNFGAPPKTFTIEPQLSQYREVVRLRATVRDGVLTHYINGRPVYRKELPPNHDSWVAIRTGDRSMGVIRDLRITGEPIIPEQIDLISNTELDGWAAYHADLSDWRVLGNTSGELELHSPCREELAGSFAENLLSYHRPLAEDGTIEYDFFYSTGESGVHPALDRLAFLLNPDGISLHTITDGKYNRSGFPPDNETPILRTQTESQPLPLIDDDWNHVRLAISGDELELFLNSRSIHRQTVDSSQPRTFGLFHYRDRTQARVRNIVWRGNWPTEIPPVFEQQLASRELQFLEDSLPQLKETYELDFSESKSPFDHFDVSEGETGDFEQQPEGTHVTTPFGNKYRNSALSPRMRLSGDFDIKAHFDRLELNSQRGGSSGVFLQAAVQNSTAQQFRVYRRLEHTQARPRNILKCVVIEQRGEKPSYTTYELVVEETTSGTFRLARRGRKAYLLFAEGDSSNYRLLGVHETTTDEIHDLRLGTQSQNKSVTQVLWKRLTIRADGIESEEKLLKQLNASRELLPDKFEHTFGKNTIPQELFELSGSLVPKANSVRIENLGTANWSASRVRPLFGLQGDFDLEVQIQDPEFVAPVVRRGTAFYFQIKYRNDNETRLDLICGKGSEGRSMVYVQQQELALGENDVERKILLDRVMLEDVEKIEALRIARRGKTIYFLYRVKGSLRDRLLSYKELTDQPIAPGDIYLMLSSGKPGELSSLKLKSFRFRAETLAPNPKELLP